ncbi:MAG: TIGR02710 family CRISPR-associated protein [Candidatus Aenigmarchaeota archaeon]|nr:TIGR02710 family CRISPR-associated protein [Candidatus Aenigmarchaeota archaeon]
MELGQLREKWKELVLKGHFNEAEVLYWENMHEISEKTLIKKVSEMGMSRYDWLIIPAGLEKRYYILLINALKPKKVYFICTKEFRNYFLDFIIQKASLKREDYEIDDIEYSGMDLAEIYGKIKDRFPLFEGKRVAVDLTRGKRIMSASAGIMASFFGFDIVYIDEEWIDEIKRGLPGTETLVRVRNPYEVFGELENNHATYLFNTYSFNSAAILFRDLCKKVADPRIFEIKALLAEGYDQWDAFNYIAAEKKLEELMGKLRQYGIRFEHAQIANNLAVLKFLANLKPGQKFEENLKNEDFVVHLLIDMYLNALRRKEVNRQEDSITRLYRLLELISQYRLSTHGITTSQPMYSKIAEIEIKYGELTKKLYGTERIVPAEIGIKDGHIILSLLQDELWKGKSFDDLKRFLGSVRIRDNSIIAHGIELIGSKAFVQFEGIARDFLQKICSMTGNSYETLLKNTKFMKLNS